MQIALYDSEEAEDIQRRFLLSGVVSLARISDRTLPRPRPRSHPSVVVCRPASRSPAIRRSLQKFSGFAGLDALISAHGVPAGSTVETSTGFIADLCLPLLRMK